MGHIMTKVKNRFIWIPNHLPVDGTPDVKSRAGPRNEAGPGEAVKSEKKVTHSAGLVYHKHIETLRN